MRRPSSLRVRLSLLGVSLMVLPLVVLVGVVVVTTENVTETSTPEGTDTAVTTSLDVSPWVPIAALAMVVPAALTSWWWAGKAVAPLRDITRVAEKIQHGSLDRRIGLVGAATEVQALAESFDSMLDRLARSSAVQRRLVADTSHSLRTPLAALATTAEVALDADDPAHHREALQTVARQAERMGQIVDDLLADARARESMSGPGDNDLAELVRRAVDQQRLATPGAAVVVDAPPHLRLGIDGAAVERALTALLENAVRHSPPGAAVTVALASAGERVTLSVTDAGPGIDAADRDRIFDRHERGPGSGGAGAGLGLAIVRHVAEAYGGVTVESPLTDAGGTRFTMTFASAR